jgi:hypothetical protein
MSTRLAFGESWMPAPSPLKPVRRSTSVILRSWCESASAAVRPPMPAPTIRTSPVAT